MTGKQNAPEIRFEGFTDPWEQRKLGDVSKKVTTKNTDGALNETFTNSAERGIVSQLDYFDHDITNEANVNGYYVVLPNDFVYNPRISTIAPCGPINRNRLNRAGVMSPLYTVFSIDDGVCKTYLEHYFKTSRWHDFMFLEGNSGARSDRFSISDSLFFEMPIWCPSLAEQEAIAQQLELTDNLITLHQRKYDKLCTVKKSMLDKMFPKPGETEPEIRFEGFTDPWEQRKFSDLTDRVSIQSSDSDLPQVEYEDIISGEGTLNKDLRDKEGGKTGIKFYAGDVLYGKLRPYLMNWLYPQFNGVAVGDFWVLRATECDSSFLYRLIQTDSFQRLANISSGSKMPRADWNLISQSFFAVPADHAEQRAIAKSLAELDNLITLHQRKLDLLKNMKKSLLDKMFV